MCACYTGTVRGYQARHLALQRAQIRKPSASASITLFGTLSMKSALLRYGASAALRRASDSTLARSA